MGFNSGFKGLIYIPLDPPHLSKIEVCTIMKSFCQNEKFISIFQLFPRGQTQPWDYGRLPQNKAKNRYGNLLACKSF